MSSELENLLKEHEPEINQLEERLKGQLTLPEYDRVFLLRYILSYKTAGEAEEACKFTLKWREENREILAQLRRETSQD